MPSQEDAWISFNNSDYKKDRGLVKRLFKEQKIINEMEKQLEEEE